MVTSKFHGDTTTGIMDFQIMDITGFQTMDTIIIMDMEASEITEAHQYLMSTALEAQGMPIMYQVEAPLIHQR